MSGKNGPTRNGAQTISSSSSASPSKEKHPLHTQNHCQLTMCFPSSISTSSTTITTSNHHYSLNDEHLHYAYSNLDDDACESDCHQWNRQHEYRSSLIPSRDSKTHLNDRTTPDEVDTHNEETSSYYSQLQQSVTSILSRVSLMKVSVCLLACATLFDMALTNIHNTTDRPTRVSLGSAAISSVTDTLSPILPFAGGLDLRRDDYWLVSDDSTWLKTLQSVITQVQDAFAAKEEASHASKTNKKSAKAMNKVKLAAPPTKKNTKSSKSSSSSYEMVISASQPFVSLETIAQLTLGDIGECFRYAMESSNVDFSEPRFYSQSLSGGSTHLRQVLQGMQDAVNRSRTKRATDWTRSTDTSSNNDASVDALKFSAAMRVFAEWRLLRQVPDGYKGFAIGMSLGHKDVVQNIIKIEESVHNYIDHQLDVCKNDEQEVIKLGCDSPQQTPTLRELLSYEIETGLHPSQRLPYLKEKSAGMGLLWVRRQLAYQTQIFDNVLHMKADESMKNAVGAAYTQVYDQYHGWAVQKIFSYSFQAAPEAEEILRYMNPRRLQELMAEQRRQKRPSSSITDTVNDTRHQDEDVDSDPNIIGQVIDHIGGEWDKLSYNVVKIFNKDAEPPRSMIQAEQQLNLDAMDVSSLPIDEVHITIEMVKDAHLQIQLYLQRIQPILQSIQSIFQDFNMNDPTRV